MTDHNSKIVGKALIIDDLEMNRHLFKTIMNNIGFEVELATNGVEGLNAIKTNLNADKKFDIVFLDMMMPEMNGIECAKQIRAVGYKGVVMAFSADVASRTSKMAKEAGVTHYFVKSSFNRELATALVNTYCGINVS